MQTKKEWITQLVELAKKIGYQNPWAVAVVGYDALRMKIEGPLYKSGDQWYASHADDPYGMLDTLVVPDDLCLREFLTEFFNSLQNKGGENFWVIPTTQVSDVVKFLVSHPRFRSNLLDMVDENPWDKPSIDFENMIVDATNQFLSNQPIQVVFQYRDVDTGVVIHQITLNEKDFWYFVDEQQMKIADRRW
ncbi:MAG: hypothetical protein IJ022_02130 [Burkholderiaceae bacterium]|nr:hypothetical protein [Burkholderiaceae bacterium]